MKILNISILNSHLFLNLTIWSKYGLRKHFILSKWINWWQKEDKAFLKWTSLMSEVWFIYSLNKKAKEEKKNKKKGI